jgi:putative ABC transport system permease protein
MLPTDDNPGGGHVAVISHALWQRAFSGDPNLIGRPITLNEQSYTVIGVAPPQFQFPAKGANVWVAPGFTARDLTMRGAHYLFVIGRLKPGVSLGQARADMTTIAQRLETDYPDHNKGIGVTLVPLREHYVEDLSLSLQLLFAAVATLLLIACANLANLFLVRQAMRQREVAMRATLGATQGRIVRETLTECIVFAAVAALFGTALSYAAFGFLAQLIPGTFPEGTALQFDWRVLCFTVGTAILTAILFGAAPALQASRLDLTGTLKRTGDRTATRASFGHIRNAAVIAQVGLTILLLVTAGLLLTSYIHIRGANTGFRPENVLTLETVLSPTKYVNPARRAEFYRGVIARVTEHPQVVSAGYVNWPPLTLKGGTNGFVIDGRPSPRPGEQPDANNRTATADYLRTIGVPLLRGRLYDDRAGADEPRVVVINQTMANSYWRGEDALGARIRFGGGGPKQPPYTVIGIVGDVKQMGLDAPPRAEMYFPVMQAPGGAFFWPRTLVVRAVGDPYNLVRDIRRAVAEIDQHQSVDNVRTMNEILDEETSDREMQATLLTVFATCALVLAIVGLYGVLSYTVAQRTREIGVRVALGAKRADVMAAIFRPAMRLTLLGMILGLVSASLTTRYVEGMLFGLTPLDPRTFLGVSMLFLIVAAVASYIPARRASRVDPLVALRYE